MSDFFVDLEKRYGAQNYKPMPCVLVRGEGVYVWDDKGNRYIDMMSAYSAVSHGHCHPKLVSTLHEQSKKLNVVSRAFYTDQLGTYLKRVTELMGFDKGLPMNTGAEAVETAIKAVRKWAYTVKKVPKNQAEIIVCENNFHGRTTTIVSFSSEKQYQYGFGPLTSGFKMIPYGDADALANAITENTAAFLVEPIQGEAGIIVPPDGYLKACEEICRRNHVLFICDEIQTGLGRTGKLLAVQYENVHPDGIVLGKALGGGLLPVSIFLTKSEVMDVFKPGDHGSTFGGNALASSIAHKALDVLLEENLIENAFNLGNYFQKELKKISSKAIADIRGKGLLIGIEIAKGYSAHEICLELLKHHVLTKETHEKVIRLAPPLIINHDQIDEVLSALTKILEAL